MPAPGAAGRPAELSRALDVPITAIGRMEPLSGGKEARITVVDETGNPIAFDHGGWTHF